MKAFCNIIMQEELDALPTVLGNTLSPSWTMLCETGYRRLVSEDTAPDGFRAVAWQYVAIDGDTANKAISGLVNIAEEQAAAEQAQADAAAAAIVAETQRQAAKPESLKRCENKWMLMSAQLSGSESPVKLGFEDLDARIRAIPDQMQQAAVAVEFNSLYNLGNYYAGPKWWDDATWHDDLT